MKGTGVDAVARDAVASGQDGGRWTVRRVAKIAARGGASYTVAQVATGVETGVLAAGLHMMLGWDLPEAVSFSMIAMLPMLLIQGWVLWNVMGPRTSGQGAISRAREAAIGLGTIGGFTLMAPLVLLSGAFAMVAPVLAWGIRLDGGMANLPGWLVAWTSGTVFLAFAGLAVAWAAALSWLRGRRMRDAFHTVLAVRGTNLAHLLIALIGGITVGWVPAKVAHHLAASDVWMDTVRSFIPAAAERSLPWLEAALQGGALRDQVAMALVVVVIGPLAEELVFRGFLWGALEKWLPGWSVLGVTSVLFALAHADPIHSPAVLLIGVFLGWLRLTSGSVLPGLLAHVINNGLGVMLAWSAVDGAGIPDVTVWSLGFVPLALGAVAWSTRAATAGSRASALAVS